MSLEPSSQFDAYVVVDWSANNRPKQGKDSIWYCVVERTGGAGSIVALENPATRRSAFHELHEILTDLARRKRATLIGFDFAYGYARGFADALGIRAKERWRETWKLISSRIRDDEQNRSNRFEVAAGLNEAVSGGPFPFWGCPAGEQRTHLTSRRNGREGAMKLNEFRLTDNRSHGPQPVWKLCYPGAVGSQSLLGIPYLEKLRFCPELAEVSRVWPFETGFRLAERSERDWTLLHAEVYPSLLDWTQQAGECKDKAQVRGLAKYFFEEDEAGRMAGFFEPPAGLVPEELADSVAEEGWILGVR